MDEVVSLGLMDICYRGLCPSFILAISLCKILGIIESPSFADGALKEVQSWLPYRYDVGYNLFFFLQPSR